MREEIEKTKKQLSRDFLKKIDNYKNKNKITYNDIARIVGIDTYAFATMRNRVKKNSSLPTKKTMEKFEKVGII